MDRIYSFLNNSGIGRLIISILSRIRRVFDIRNANKLIESYKNTNTSKSVLKIGFIVQMPQVWDKEKPVFDRMLEDNRFDSYLVVVPEYDIKTQSICSFGTELEYFSSMYDESRIIKGIKEDGSVIEIGDLDFDYVFYQRPYDSYLPVQLRAKAVLPYARTVYIPYYFSNVNQKEDYYKSVFFNNIYLYFQSSNETGIVKKKKSKRIDLNIGYPALDNMKVETKTGDTIKGLWTPRWTDDPLTGGSTFIKYMELIVEWAASIPNFELILRPHPLAFDYAIAEGKLTEEEVIRYKDKVEKLGIKFDKNPIADDTIKEIDIMITDSTSIILNSYIRNIPIVYCTNPELNFSDEYKKIIKTCYIAKDWNEVVKYSTDIINGVDPLLEEREKVINTISKGGDATGRIVDYIYNDYNSN